MGRALMSMCAVIAVTLATTAGCAGDREPQSPPPRPRVLDWQQELRVSDAQQHLIRQCMSRHGFAYWEDRGLTLQESRPVRYVQDDVAWARIYGYGGRVDERNQRIHDRNPNGTYRLRLSASRRTAFDIALDGGDSARILTAPLPGGGEIRKRLGGCTEEAEHQLYGDPAVWFRTGKIATGLNALYGARLMHDRELSSAIRAWSRCMKRAGHPFKDPQAARDAIRVNTGRLGADRTEEAFTAERRTAVADATCARETSLGPVATARETYYLDRLRDRFGADIDTYRRLGQRAYDRAVRIVPKRG